MGAPRSGEPPRPPLRSEDPAKKLWGRKQDRPLKARQAALWESLLPKLALPDPSQGVIDPAALFPGKSSFALEVGFGGGEHLAWQAARAPDRGFFGAEPFVNGVAKLLAAIDDGGLDNIRILHGDARLLIDALPAACLDAVYVLHPDPWPKKRHWKRRIIQPDFLDALSRVMRPGAELRVASDIPHYVFWTLMHAGGREDFRWTAETRADWEIRPADWPETRYAAKAVREGRTPAFLRFERV